MIFTTACACYLYLFSLPNFIIRSLISSRGWAVFSRKTAIYCAAAPHTSSTNSKPCSPGALPDYSQWGILDPAVESGQGPPWGEQTASTLSTAEAIIAPRANYRGRPGQRKAISAQKVRSRDNRKVASCGNSALFNKVYILLVLTQPTLYPLGLARYWPLDIDYS